MPCASSATTASWPPRWTGSRRSRSGSHRPMALLPVRLYPDPVRRARAAPVERFDDESRRLGRDMIETLHAAPGVGLAAPQVGVGRRVAIVDLSVGERPEELHILVNPVLVSSAGSLVEEEGCLSIPGRSEERRVGKECRSRWSPYH